MLPCATFLGVSSLISPIYCFPREKAPGGTSITCQWEGKPEFSWDHPKPCREPKGLNLAVPKRQMVLSNPAALEKLGGSENQVLWCTPCPRMAHRHFSVVSSLTLLCKPGIKNRHTHVGAPFQFPSTQKQTTLMEFQALQKSHPLTSLISSKE